MTIPKWFRRLISFFLSFTLLFQTLTPAFVFAEEVSPEPTIIEEQITPTPEPTPVETVTPTPTEIPTPEVIPEPTSTLEPVPVPTRKPLWAEVDDNTITTSENVGEGTDYRFRDTNLIVHFTKVTKPGKLTIRKVKFTPEQIASTGALSDTAYDITSDMENGTFVYNLTLPISQAANAVDVKFAQDAGSLTDSQSVSQTEEIKTDSVAIRGLNHFTLFYVVSGEDRSEDEGEICDMLPCAINPVDVAALQDIDGETFDVGSITGWPNLGISEGRYVEFDFGSISPDGVDGATLRLDYATENVEEGSVEVEVRVFDGEDWITVAASDQVSSVDLLPDLTTDQLNNLKVRFFMFADPIAGEIVKTIFDRVVLDISIADTTPPTATINYSTIAPTNGDVTVTLVPSETVTVTNNGGSDSYIFTANGTFIFEFVDTAGNTSSATATVGNIDKTPPTGSITLPANGSYKNTKPTFRASAGDDNGIASVKFQYKPDGPPDFIDLNTDTIPNASGLYQASWSGVTLVNGIIYDLQIIITDGVGNQYTVGGVSFLYDTQLPGILYNNPLGGETAWYNYSPLFDIDFLYDEGGTPLDYAQYRLDSGSYKNIFTADRTSDYTANWGIASWSTLSEGLHQLDLRLRDKAGNINTDNYQEGEFGLKVGKDLTAPVVRVPDDQTLEAESESGAVYEFSPVPSASDDNSTSGVTCDYASGATFPIDTTTVTCEAKDPAGNIGRASFDITVQDTVIPTSIITTPSNNGTNSLIYSNSWDGSILGTAADNESGLARVDLSIQRTSDEKYWNGEGWVEAEDDEPRMTADGTESWSYSLSEPREDTYEIVSHAVDRTGNIENSYKLTVVLDKTIPEVSLTINPTDPDSGNGWYKTDPTIILTATDANNDRVEYQWDSQTGTWNIYSSPFKTPGEGDHALYYRAFDLAGNVSATGIKRVKYDQTELEKGPQNVSVSPNPTSGNTAKVKWDAASDNVGIDKYEINWSLDGTSTSYTQTVGNDVREHEIDKLDQEGKWNVKVIAFDSAGNKKDGSVELTVDRGAPAAPTLRLDGAGTGEATLGWNLVGDAVDYTIWYGSIPGAYIFGARVGNVNSFTVRGLGGGDYYFIVKSLDSVGNQSGNSNEVNTLALVGVPGVEPGTPAEGFLPEVRGASTEITPTETVTPSSEILGESESKNSLPVWLILLLLTSGGLASWAFLRRH